MQRISAFWFVACVNGFARAEERFSKEKMPNGTMLSSEDIDWLKKGLIIFLKGNYIPRIHLPVTSRLCEELGDDVSWQQVPVDWIRYKLPALKQCFEAETGGMCLLLLNAGEANYFRNNPSTFGAEFDGKFQGAAFDLDEAAKCFALGRYTASVFHLMRILESGIRAVARCLQIPDPIKPAERNWARILERIIRDGIEKKWPTAADRMSGDGALFESLHASLDAVRNPWRNATMHVENKYTEDEAEHIFVAVKGFMKKLATRCDEGGQPLA